MTPQLYITVYKEQFASPARVKRAELRPTSAHRRNNPQPRPDFLFPRSLQPSYRAANTQPHPSLPELSGRPLFPPIRQLSFHSPVTTSPGNCLNAVCLGGPQHMPPVNSAAELDLPSGDRVQKLQLTEPDAALKNPQRRIDYQGNVNPPSTARSCYSCFHVVKPYQAGHYIIHPEFVSECFS
ncbi:hypothetical protein EXN66_Car005268 [Channa argus]|uniref:Uncharacterized protein n=1 Tax=Channa argus TaxID=215402 RepID=A0A6G1PHV2_CHAAH|nr:hypothetical protein EXN66_Car005268 [Channa argus]